MAIFKRSFDPLVLARNVFKEIRLPITLLFLPNFTISNLVTIHQIIYKCSREE